MRLAVDTLLLVDCKAPVINRRFYYYCYFFPRYLILPGTEKLLYSAIVCVVRPHPRVSAGKSHGRRLGAEFGGRKKKFRGSNFQMTILKKKCTCAQNF